MKKYLPKITFPFGVLALICLTCFVVGIAVNAVGYSTQLTSVLALVGGITGSFLLMIFLLVLNSPVLIYRDRVVFSTAVRKNGKSVSGRTVIKFDDIEFIDHKFIEGDHYITDDCYCHLLKLKDGTEITVFLNSYGRRKEDEIMSTVEFLLHQSRTASAKRTDKK